jgi:hypothetical protein
VRKGKNVSREGREGGDGDVGDVLEETSASWRGCAARRKERREREETSDDRAVAAKHHSRVPFELLARYGCREL